MNKQLFTSKNIIPVLIIGLLFFVYRHFAGSPAFESYKLSGLTMGTFYRVEIVGKKIGSEDIEMAKLRADLVLSGIDNTMSTYKPDSDISRFNAWNSLDEMSVSGELVDVVTASIAVAKDTEGAFDPTVGPLVNLWGFGSEDRSAIPEKAKIEDVRQKVGYQHLSIPSNASLKKAVPELQLDLSAVAKGAGVDMVLLALNDMGYSNTLVEVGGEIAASGHNSRGRTWKISVEKPKMDAGVGESSYAIIEFNNAAVATSGDYRNYRSEDGLNYSHVIDPRTGWPVSNNVASATVIAPDCMTADAFATALMVLGPEKGIQIIEEKEGMEAMVVVRSGNGAYLDYQTSGFASFVYQK